MWATFRLCANLPCVVSQEVPESYLLMFRESYTLSDFWGGLCKIKSDLGFGDPELLGPAELFGQWLPVDEGGFSAYSAI